MFGWSNDQMLGSEVMMLRAREPDKAGFVEWDGVLRRHFGQNHHVARRLDPHCAGRKTDFETANSRVIAESIATESIATETGREVNRRDVENDGAAARLTAMTY
jgi:hypothetical protein